MCIEIYPDHSPAQMVIWKRAYRTTLELQHTPMLAVIASGNYQYYQALSIYWMVPTPYSGFAFIRCGRAHDNHP